MDRIAARAKGEVDVRYVGRIRARAKPWYRSKQRPLLIGSSIGFLASGFIMAGTLGCFVRSGSSSALYILSNNHVLADENRYPKGGHIVQPGALDGGSPTADRVAKLTRFVRLEPRQTNFVDCAIAKLNATIQADVHKLKGIGTLGRPAQQRPAGGRRRAQGGAHDGRAPWASDRVRTGWGGGRVRHRRDLLRQPDRDRGRGEQVVQRRGGQRLAHCRHQMLAAALLFAGGDHGGSNGKGLTFANPIAAVLQALRVELA